MTGRCAEVPRQVVVDASSVEDRVPLRGPVPAGRTFDEVLTIDASEAHHHAMSTVRSIVFVVMDRGCALTGHRLWYCYNAAPSIVKRLWWWSANDD